MRCTTPSEMSGGVIRVTFIERLNLRNTSTGAVLQGIYAWKPRQCWILSSLHGFLVNRRSINDENGEVRTGHITLKPILFKSNRMLVDQRTLAIHGELIFPEPTAVFQFATGIRYDDPIFGTKLLPTPLQHKACTAILA